jgi:hypothetical protein
VPLAREKALAQGAGGICNGLIISEAETDNIHLRRPTIIDNINRCEPTLFDNQPTLGDNSLITSLSTQIN